MMVLQTFPVYLLWVESVYIDAFETSYIYGVSFIAFRIFPMGKWFDPTYIAEHMMDMFFVKLIVF